MAQNPVESCDKILRRLDSFAESGELYDNGLEPAVALRDLDASCGFSASPYEIFLADLSHAEPVHPIHSDVWQSLAQERHARRAYSAFECVR